MKPIISSTRFGSITIEGKTYEHDIIIRLNGRVKKRKKKLSKAVYGTSHTVSLEEAEFVYETGATGLVVGTGQYGALELSGEALEFLKINDCHVKLLSTPEAIQLWNEKKGQNIGLFHVTC